MLFTWVNVNVHYRLKSYSTGAFWLYSSGWWYCICFLADTDVGWSLWHYFGMIEMLSLSKTSSLFLLNTNLIQLCVCGPGQQEGTASLHITFSFSVTLKVKERISNVITIYRTYNRKQSKQMLFRTADPHKYIIFADNVMKATFIFSPWNMTCVNDWSGSWTSLYQWLIQPFNGGKHLRRSNSNYQASFQTQRDKACS